MSFLDDLRNLDRNNIGGWPKSVKTFFATIIVVVIFFFGWYLHISGQQDELESVRQKENALKKEFSDKQAKAVNLEAYRKQLEDMKEMLQTMLRQLPSKTEMPDLLNDISDAALGSGIETQLFQPGAEAMKDFYAEKPIQLKMLGTYHQFGSFISSVAALPRVVILTMHDVSLRPVKTAAAGAPAATAANGGQLSLEGTVKTYRYLDDEEAASVQQAATAGKPGAPPPPKPATGPSDMNRFPSHLIRNVVLLLSLGTLAACTPDEDPHQWVAREKAKRGAPLQPLPVIKTFETFVYKDQDRRNPFDLSVEEQEQASNTGPHPDQNRAREPLESFPLDGLKMAGTLGLTKTMEGLVRDPDGVVHRVHLGNFLGQNFGRITAIGEDRIDLVELVPNGSGGWMERPAAIALGDTKQ